MGCRVMQAKLFPQYFAVAIAAGVLQLGTLAFGVPGGIAQTQLITLGKNPPSHNTAFRKFAKNVACKGGIVVLVFVSQNMSSFLYSVLLTQVLR